MEWDQLGPNICYELILKNRDRWVEKCVGQWIELDSLFLICTHLSIEPCSRPWDICQNEIVIFEAGNL